MTTSPIDTEVFHAMPSGSKTVIVSFGAKGGGQGVFHFFKVLKPLRGFTKLLVRDPAGSWYNAGLPGVGDTVEDIAARIKQEVAALGGERIITSGPSMGGYAAILFGCMLGAERAIALAPQTLLDRGQRHAPPAGVELQAPDLRPIIRDAPATKIDLVAGWDDPLDIFNAGRVAALPSVRILALRGGTHSFVEDLHREEKLIPLFTDLVLGVTPEICEVDPSLDPEEERRIGDTAYAAQRKDWEIVERAIRPVAERNPDWAGPSFELGRALARMGDWASAEAPLASAVRVNPRWANAQLELGRCLMQLGRTDEGRTPARRAAMLEPKLANTVERLLG